MVYSVQEIKLENFALTESAQLYMYRLDNTPQSDANRLRPAVIICPGGGYQHLSDRESEPIAMRYLAAGYHAFVLRYHVAPAEYPVALLELAKSVQLIRENAKEWHVDEEKVIVSGFSAGGHLAAGLALSWNEAWIAKALNTTSDLLKVNGCLLSYPVITAKEHAHRGSFVNLLGSQYDSLIDQMSLEDRVNDSTPPMFIWHTFEDNAVPVENSLLLVSALRKHQINTEFHMYPHGSHGLALANQETQTADGKKIVEECQGWIDLAIRWIRNLGGRQC